MAFLAPLAAAGKATTALGAGFKLGATAGKLVAPTTVGLKSLGYTLGPQIGGAGSSLLTGTGGSLLGGGGGSLLGGGLGSLGGVGLKAGAGALLPGSTVLPGAAVVAPGITSTAAPGLLKTMGMNPLGGMSSVLPAGTTAPTATGLKSLGVDATKGFLGNVTKIKPPTTTLTSPFTEATNKSVLDAIQVSKEVPRVLPAPAQPLSSVVKGQNFLQNATNFIKDPSMQGAKDFLEEHPYASAGAAYLAYDALKSKPKQPEVDKGMIRPYDFDYNQNAEAYAVSPTADSSERLYFNPTFTALEPYKAAEGGLMGLAVGGPVETMSAMNAVGGNMDYPQANLQTALYSNPMMQRPESVNVISPGEGPAVGAYTGEQKFADGGNTKEPKTEGQYSYSYDPKTLTFTQLTAPRYADNVSKNTPPLNTGAKTSGGIASPAGGPGIASLMPTASRYAGPPIPAYQTPEERLGLTDFYSAINQQLAEMGGYAAGGGVSDLGGYSDGGRLLKGPGDGVSDSIPAVIGERQPARLADGEFVVPARIVSELGNGSTEAGARKLYAMMDRVQKARRKTVGKSKVAANTKADKYLPA